ncbi:unnamed protein product [Mesocestoides corti]|uniref:MD-2-related lipid-recognition domain-containing protein n=1 Tax=Mesocestoides corti TaxID=53468 RepID=A0A0R3U1I7_MESCO|nr:unnamed protein product [Mesocestoides corti]
MEDCTGNEVIKSGKIVVHGIIGGIPIPFSLPDNDLCHFVKPGCTIQPNAIEQMDYELFVKESYPSIHVTIKWELVDETGGDVICIKFPAQLSSTPPPPQRPTTLFGHIRQLFKKWFHFGA